MILFCLPYAGGNVYSFRGLRPYLHHSINAITLELPGRGQRAHEALVSDLEYIVDDLYYQLLPRIDNHYMIYGHSMGGTLGNLIIHRLNNEKKPLPAHLLVTGCMSPRKRYLSKMLHQLNDEDFQKELKEMGGIPDKVMENQELIEYIMPIIRSDIKALETYPYHENNKYNVPITAISGTEERFCTNDMLYWNYETSSSMNYFSLPGDHFFIYEHYDKIAEIINRQSAAASDIISI